MLTVTAHVSLDDDAASDKTRYGAHGVVAGDAEGQAARMLRACASGVRCAGFVGSRGGRGAWGPIARQSSRQAGSQYPARWQGLPSGHSRPPGVS